MESRILRFTVNGRKREVIIEPNQTLLWVLREKANAIDVKNGCEKGDCGACTVIMNGKAVNSCLVLAAQCEGADIITSSGLGSMESPHPIHVAFADLEGAQCGYCTPGMVLSTKALLDENPHPTDEEIRIAISGNLCRCTGYGQIVRAIQKAADLIDESKKEG
ncbi:MAG TPA: (2Fe-2S)-binding protein [Bellilinea sp.]|nr:(2Fe-2S)-binding protein [Bellilinea sp.]